MRWRAWFTNDRIFDSQDVTWRELPDDGVLVVRVLADEGQQSIYGYDHYFHDDKLIAGSDDEVETIINRYDVTESDIKLGKWTDYETWLTVKREAQRFGLWRNDD